MPSRKGSGRSDRLLLEELIDPLRAAPARRNAFSDSVARVGTWDPRRVVDLLVRHGLDQLWLRAVGGPRALEPQLRSLLGRQRAIAVLARARREHLVEHTFAALGDDVSGVIFKGEHLCHAVYPDPLLRPCADVDLLVDPSEVSRAVARLVEAGFRVEWKAKNLSHELTLRGFGGELDLHWDVFRPGRARIDLARWVLEERVALAGRSVPSPAAAVVLMLIHPALTKHVTGRLIRAVDLDRWIRLAATPWERILAILESSGLRTAAWATLTWTRSWLDTPVPDDVMEALSPGPVRSRYLARWLRADPARQYRTHPNLVRLGFSLALQDSAEDATRALRLRRAARGEPDDLPEGLPELLADLGSAAEVRGAP